MCFRMKQKKNDEEHWLPASPELQAFLASIKVRSKDGPIALRRNGKPWESEAQLQKRSSNFLTELARKGIVGPGLTEHGLRVTFAAEIKRLTGANDDQVAAGAWRPRRPHGHALYPARRAREQDHIPVGAANENRTRFGKREG